MKICSRCKTDKPFEAFSKNARSKNGLRSYCRDCASLYYQGNSARHKAGCIAKTRVARNSINEKICTYLSCHPCVDCGEDDVVVLDFDHVRDQKIDNVATMVARRMRWEVILLEIAKCDIRCANCHRRKTAREGNTFRHTWAEQLPALRTVM